MPSLFGKRSKAASNPPLPLSNGVGGPPTPAKGRSVSASAKSSRAATLEPDEHGRAAPAFASPRLAPGGTGLRRSASDSARPHTISIDEELQAGCADSLQLAYGYFPIETERVLDLLQIRARGLDTPLILSSRALDISVDGISQLIRSWFADKRAFFADVRLASPHDLGGVLKWALGRYVNPQGKHGYLSWELYERWRAGEREKGWPPRYISTHLLYHLPTSTADLLTALLELLSSVAAYTVQNGSTPRKLAALFSSFIFGLPDDLGFEETYALFLRYTHATEHLLLAFIRDQKEAAAGTSIAKKLEDFISNYPHDLPTNPNKPHPQATLIATGRIQRYVRFHSKDLIATSPGWDVPRSNLWTSLYPLPSAASSSQMSSGSNAAAGPMYTSRYRHLLNISAHGADEDDVRDELHKHRDASDKDWSMFKDAGFLPADNAKLKFDLTETERNKRIRHATMDWSAFSGTGFLGRESFIDQDLSFDPAMEQDVGAWPQQRSELTSSLRKAEKALPAFAHDVTPHELQPIAVDATFFEAWADTLVASGWQRDELKASAWVFVQLRARPKHDVDPATGMRVLGDGRTEERWVLFEEIIPADYLRDLHDGKKQKKGITFLRKVRRRPTPKPAKPSSPAIGNGAYSSHPPTSGVSPSTARPTISAPKPIDESVFAPGPGGETRMLKLSKSPVMSSEPSPAVSRSTTVRRNGAGEPMLSSDSDRPPVPGGQQQQFLGFGVDGTLSSQRSSRPMPIIFNSVGGGGGGKAPSPRSGFMARMRSLGQDQSSPASTEFDHETRTIGEEDARALSDADVATIGHEGGMRPESGAVRPRHRSELTGQWVDVLVSPDRGSFQAPRSVGPASPFVPAPPLMPTEREAIAFEPADEGDESELPYADDDEAPPHPSGMTAAEAIDMDHEGVVEPATPITIRAPTPPPPDVPDKADSPQPDRSALGRALASANRGQSPTPKSPVTPTEPLLGGRRHVDVAKLIGMFGAQTPSKVPVRPRPPA